MSQVTIYWSILDWNECSHHLLNELIDQFLSVTISTISLGEWVSLNLKSTKWGWELEWPQEVVGFLELWTASGDLVDEVLDAVDTVLAEFTSDDAIFSKWNSASVHLTSSSLVNKILDHVSWWISKGNVWFNNSNHVPCGFVELDEHSVVQLSQSKELQNLLWLWGKLVDTLNPDDESYLCLSLNVELTCLLGGSLSIDSSLISCFVLFRIFHCVLLGLFSWGLPVSFSLNESCFSCFQKLGISI